MSKRDNGWYLLEGTVHSFRRLMRPRLSGLAVGVPVAVAMVLLMTYVG
ncbi:MAG: hypothetical protein JWM82_3845, partial [Myxococcales bacterium]|nr:hypothetical protein [Myxococcales bacterium]